MKQRGPQVTEDEAFANVLRVFPNACIVADAAVTAADTVRPSSDEANAACRKGLCVGCRTRRYSPGRTRCEDCHRDWICRRSL
jgi:hypothetical protein